MTSLRGSNGGGEARWSGLVALADLGSRVLSAPAALPACYTAALRRLTPSRRFEGAWSKTAGSLRGLPRTLSLLGMSRRLMNWRAEEDTRDEPSHAFRRCARRSRSSRRRSPVHRSFYRSRACRAALDAHRALALLPDCRGVEFFGLHPRFRLSAPFAAHLLRHQPHQGGDDRHGPRHSYSPVRLGRVHRRFFPSQDPSRTKMTQSR